MQQRAYDLMILIDPDVAEERRTGIVADIKKQIDSGEGELKGDADWGVRKLAYEIDHRPEAYYHLFQLEAGPELLTQLEHSLAIDDGVLRHRILRLPKGVPETTPKAPPASVRHDRDERGSGSDRGPGGGDRVSGSDRGPGSGDRGGPAGERGATGDSAPAGEPRPAGDPSPSDDRPADSEAPAAESETAAAESDTPERSESTSG